MTKTYPYVGSFTVTSDFGYRNISYGSTYHKGIDLGSTDGNLTIASATPGTVQRASADAGSGYGNHVYVTNQDGTGCLYAHLSSIDVSVGQQVSCGTKIGMQGGSGSSGPNTYASHLHFGVSKSGTYAGAHSDSRNWVNPAIWFGMASSGQAKCMSF